MSPPRTAFLATSSGLIALSVRGFSGTLAFPFRGFAAFIRRFCRTLALGLGDLPLSWLLLLRLGDFPPLPPPPP